MCILKSTSNNVLSWTWIAENQSNLWSRIFWISDKESTTEETTEKEEIGSPPETKSVEFISRVDIPATQGILIYSGMFLSSCRE